MISNNKGKTDQVRSCMTRRGISQMPESVRGNDSRERYEGQLLIKNK